MDNFIKALDNFKGTLNLQKINMLRNRYNLEQIVDSSENYNESKLLVVVMKTEAEDKPESDQEFIFGNKKCNLFFLCFFYIILSFSRQ